MKMVCFSYIDIHNYIPYRKKYVKLFNYYCFFRLKRTFPLTTRNPGNGNPTVQFANAVQNLAHSRFTQQRRQSFPRKRLYSDGILFTTFLSLMFMIQIQGKYQI